MTQDRNFGIVAAMSRRLPNVAIHVVLALSAAACGCASDIGGTGPYLQQATGSSVTVAWRTEEPAVGAVRWGLHPDVLDREVRSPAAGRHHALVLSDLPPGERIHYRYEPSDRSIPANRLFYDVPADDESRLRFWVIGDSGTGTIVQRAVAAAMEEVEAKEGAVGLLLHVGDIAYESGTAWQLVHRFFRIYDFLPNTVVWPALGNHDVRRVDTVEGIGPWFDFFVLPANGEAGGVPSGSEAYYAFDRGPAHFVVLDSATGSLTPDTPMLRWLERDLAANERPWTIAVLHHAPYSDGSHDSADDERMTLVRENVVPILERHGVDVVFSGHSHAYERTALLAGGSALDGDSPYEKAPGPRGGTVYVVSGHGGAETGGRLRHPLVVAASKSHGALLVEIDGDELRVRNIGLEGETADEWKLIEAAR